MKVGETCFAWTELPTIDERGEQSANFAGEIEHKGAWSSSSAWLEQRLTQQRMTAISARVPRKAARSLSPNIWTRNEKRTDDSYTGNGRAKVAIRADEDVRRGGILLQR